MTAESTVQQIIDAAQSQADAALDKAIAYTDAAQTAAIVVFDLGLVPSPTNPNVEVPPFVNPAEDLVGQYKIELSAALAELVPGFDGQVNNFITNWFPDFAGCLKEQVDQWICKTIQSGGTGIPVDVENQIWERSRNREIIDASRQQSEVITAFAARGFALPSGVLLDAVQRVQQDLSNKNSTHSRDVAIKQAEIEIENIRFAVEQGVRLRLGVVQALVEFVNTWLRMQQTAIDRAKAVIDAKRDLWQAAAAYYRALIDVAELDLKYDEIRIDSALKQAALVVQAGLGGVDAKVKAAVGAAETLANFAASAIGAQNTLANIEHSTIVTG